MPDIRLRPPKLPDAAAIEGLIDPRSRLINSQTVADQLRNPLIHPDQNWRVAVTDDEHIIGSIRLWTPPPFDETHMALHINPEYETACQRLLQWGEAQIVQQQPHVPEVMGSVLFYNDDNMLREILAERGYQPDRYYWRMERKLGELIKPDTLPGELRLTNFADVQDWQQLYSLIRTSFPDHPAYNGPETAEDIIDEWQYAAQTDSTVDLNHWPVILAGDQIIGVAMIKADCENTTAAFIDTLAVSQDWRGQGIGWTLLHTVFDWMKTCGCQVVALDVDSANPTGATRLYEKAGMQIVYIREKWHKVL